MDYLPKRPVRSFLDLEVYQWALEAAVFVAKFIVPVPKLPNTEAERPAAEVEPALDSGSPMIKSTPDVNTPDQHRVLSREDVIIPDQHRVLIREDVIIPDQHRVLIREKYRQGPAFKSGQLRQRDQLLNEAATSAAERLILQNMLPCALGLPHLIAEAHSFRFGNRQECLILLEKAMLRCNKMVVYLEETRDIIDTGVEWGKFDELIKKYLFVRRKLLNLQRSWKRYMSEK